MTVLSEILEVIKYILPALVVFFTIYLIMKNWLENDYNKRLFEFQSQNKSNMLPAKMQAYERLTLFLERINPPNLLIRLNKPFISALAFKQELIDTINEEFNHNVAQQLYVSHQAWNLIKVVKEEQISLIVNCYNKLEKNASGNDLSKAVLEEMIKREDAIVQKAIDFLKKEFKLIFD